MTQNASTHSASTPLRIVQRWQEAANTRDIALLGELSAPDIAVVGPRGSGFGRQLLVEWLGRAGLTLTTVRAFVRGDMVVLEQRGVWRALDTGEVTGDQSLASVFHVNQHGQVDKFARYGHLGEALEAAGLDEQDEVR